MSENTTCENQEEQKPTEGDIVKRMEAVLAEITTLQEDLKQLKNDSKRFGYKGAVLAKIAKLRSSGKIGDYFDESQALLNKTEELGL